MKEVPRNNGEYIHDSIIFFVVFYAQDACAGLHHWKVDENSTWCVKMFRYIDVHIPELYFYRENLAYGVMGKG